MVTKTRNLKVILHQIKLFTYSEIMHVKIAIIINQFLDQKNYINHEHQCNMYFNTQKHMKTKFSMFI